MGPLLHLPMAPSYSQPCEPENSRHICKSVSSLQTSKLLPRPFYIVYLPNDPSSTSVDTPVGLPWGCRSGWAAEGSSPLPWLTLMPWSLSPLDPPHLGPEVAYTNLSGLLGECLPWVPSFYFLTSALLPCLKPSELWTACEARLLSHAC